MNVWHQRHWFYVKDLKYIISFFQKVIIEFDNEETIIDIVNHYLDDGKALEKITDKAQKFIYENHYWKHRIDKFKHE